MPSHYFVFRTAKLEYSRQCSCRITELVLLDGGYHASSMKQTAAATLCVLILSITVAFFHFPDVLLVGSITEDVIGGEIHLGGAVSYAAAVSASLGKRACVVYSARPDSSPRLFTEDHVARVVPANATLTFEHSYTYFGELDWWQVLSLAEYKYIMPGWSNYGHGAFAGNHRKLRVVAEPDVKLSWEHVPFRCRWAKTILLGPLTQNDVDVESFVRQDALQRTARTLIGKPRFGIMGQGLQRQLDQTGMVGTMPEPSIELIRALTKDVTVFLSDVETDPWPKPRLEEVVAKSKRVFITRGRDGADEYIFNGTLTSQNHMSHPVQKVVDTNGAGDSFATAYMLAESTGHPSPAYFANFVASIIVTLPQNCKPKCIQQDNILRNASMSLSSGK